MKQKTEEEFYRDVCNLWCTGEDIWRAGSRRGSFRVCSYDTHLLSIAYNPSRDKVHESSAMATRLVDIDKLGHVPYAVRQKRRRAHGGFSAFRRPRAAHIVIT